MPARLQPPVLVVLRADFAQLKRGAHVAIHVVLLLGTLYARGASDRYGRRDVNGSIVTVGVQVKILLVAVYERLH